jgi:hypothetical protein
VKELRAKVKQLEKALKQERDEARRYKSQLDLLRGDMEVQGLLFTKSIASPCSDSLPF